MAKAVPIMLSSEDVKFLDDLIVGSKIHRKSRSAIVRHLIAKARKDKKLID